MNQMWFILKKSANEVKGKRLFRQTIIRGNGLRWIGRKGEQTRYHGNRALVTTSRRRPTSTNGLPSVEQVVDVSGLLVVKPEYRPQSFNLSLSFMRVSLRWNIKYKEYWEINPWIPLVSNKVLTHFSSNNSFLCLG